MVHKNLDVLPDEFTVFKEVLQPVVAVTFQKLSKNVKLTEKNEFVTLILFTND